MMCFWPKQQGGSSAMRLLLLLVGGACMLSPIRLAAAEPARLSSLARLAPADVGLCLETDRLGERAADFLHSELFQRMKRFPPLAKWVGDNGARTSSFHSEFERRFGLAPRAAWSGIFSGRALFAVWPPAAQEENGAALLVVESVNREMLEQVLKRVVELQRDSGKWQRSFTLDCNQQECTVHVFSGQKHEELYLTSAGDLGLAANREDLIRLALKAYSHPSDSHESLADLPGYVAACERLSPSAAVRLFVNPRPWDQGLAADLHRKPPDSRDAQAQRIVIDTWRATDYVIAGLDLGTQVSLEAYAAWNVVDLPAPIRDATESLGGTAEFAASIPRDALIAAAGRVDVGRLVWQFGLRAIAKAKRDSSEAGATAKASVAPSEWLLPATFSHGLGPDFGVYIAGHSVADPVEPQPRQGKLPVEWAAGINTRPLEPGDQRPPLAELLEPVVHSALIAAAAAAQGQSAKASPHVTDIQIGGRRMTAVRGLFGPRNWPLDFTFARDESRFWIGGEPDVIQRTLDLPPANSLANLPELKRLASPSQFLYLRLSGIRELIQSSPGIARFFGSTQQFGPEAPAHGWRELLALSELADVAIASIRFDASGPAALICISADSSLPGHEVNAPQLRKSP